MSCRTAHGHLSVHAAIVKPQAGPSSDTYSEEDWNTEVDENAQGADAYRYSKVPHACTCLSSTIQLCKRQVLHVGTASVHVACSILSRCALTLTGLLSNECRQLCVGS